jgi:hypothetical protein
MKKFIHTCLLITSLGLGTSFSVQASNVVTTTLDDTEQAIHHTLFGWNDWHPDYLLEDKDTGYQAYLDGVDYGTKLDDPSYIHKDYSHYYGDRLTDLRTHHSGTITGVKDQGTMDVLSSKGNMVRYEYVVFKVKK